MKKRGERGEGKEGEDYYFCPSFLIRLLSQRQPEEERGKKKEV